MFRINLFVLLATVTVAQGTLITIIKPGFCPAPTGPTTGSCSFTCTGDGSCLLSNKKCCPTACGGTVCSAPLATAPVIPPTVAPTTKDGVCVAPTYPNKESCFGTVQNAGCVKDADCTGTQKCCSNGCVLSCKAPEVPKPGFCPAPGGFYTGSCFFDCKSDSYCPLSTKCCPTLCGGNVCSIPRSSAPIVTVTPAPTTKTGTCPAPTYLTKDSCYRTSQIAGCVKDADCTGTNKCCTNGCVLSCKAALP